MRSNLLDVLRCPRSGQRLSLDARETAGDDVAFGLLTSEAGIYPVVAGIPVFTAAGKPAVAAVQSGASARAVAEVFCASAQGSRSWRVASMMSRSGALHGSVRAAGDALRRREVDAVAAALQKPDLGVTDILSDAFLRGDAPMSDAHEYFRYRLGTPRHLVVLSVLEALPDPSGLVGDFGCGGGHLTWAMSQRWPDADIVALDLDFRLLLAARQMVGPAPTLVCADMRQAPLASGALDLALSSDVLSYVEDKSSVVREMERCLTADGTLTISSVKDAAADHVFAGLPLSLDGWRLLVEHLDHRVIPDDLVLERYLDGKGLPADDSALAPGASQLVTLLASRRRLDLASDQDFSDWPHARGPLGLNPLYVPVPREGVSAYARHLPQGVYGRDNLELASYLPPTVQLDDDTLAAARRGERPKSLDSLVSATAVLAYPDAYNADRWPSAVADGTARP